MGSESGPDFVFIGRNIRRLRKAQKLRQEELGRRLSQRTLSRQAIGAIENGGNTDLGTIADIARALRVDPLSLMAGAQDTASSAIVEGRSNGAATLVAALGTTSPGSQ